MDLVRTTSTVGLVPLKLCISLSDSYLGKISGFHSGKYKLRMVLFLER
jgi:hypothetical protein